MEYELTIFILSGTAGTLVMAAFIIYFVISYQKKSFDAQLRFEQLKTRAEKEATLASFRGQENERQRIAKDRHDDIGASLTAIKMSMRFLGDKFKKNKALHEELMEIRDTLTLSIDGIRAISHNLMPYALTNLGISRSVEQLVNRVANPPHYKTTFHTSGASVRLNEEVRLMLFRSIQEIIHNSIKHSRAALLKVNFTWEKDQLSIRIEDNGCGFNYEKTLNNVNSGIGLKNLESRFRIIGVTHHVKSDENGTGYHIILPLNSNTKSL